MKVEYFKLLMIFSIALISCTGKDQKELKVEIKTTSSESISGEKFVFDDYNTEYYSVGRNKIENFSIELNSTNSMLDLFKFENNTNLKIYSLDVNVYGSAYWITNYSIYFQRNNEFTENYPVRFIERFDTNRNEIVNTPFTTFDLFAITDDEKYICFSRPVHKKNTNWGPIYAQNIYLYDLDKREVLRKYDVLELVADDFYGGLIQCSYNKDEQRFDFIFSLDSVGNYGTAYIDLKEYIFHR